MNTRTFKLTTERERTQFVEGYLECLLWSTPTAPQDPEADCGPTPYDSCIPVDPETEREIRELALNFLESNERALGIASRDRSWEYLGHDAHLTREGHGTGFWDRGDIRKPLRDILTNAAKVDRTEIHLWEDVNEEGEPVIRGDIR